VGFAQKLGERAPSYGTVFNIVRRLGADLVLLAHEGSKAYSETFELVHRREAAGPNAISQADHTPPDIWLNRPDGQTAKPWLTVVIDDYSRAVAGYFLSFEAPCTLHTSLALRQAIWRKEDARWIVCAIPEVLYTDHGSDFTSRHLEQVSADLKIRLVFSLPGKPRGRGRIERFFATINEMFLCELDGYVPAGGAVRGKPTLTLAAFEARLRTFLLDVYQRRDCAETKMPHQPQPTRPPSGNHHPPSSATETNSGHPSVIVETLEHRRFAEFCDTCRRYGYIGLCYGPPGVGKTLSARSYSRWDKVNQADRWGTGPGENPALDTVFYTPAVVNVPGKVDAEIKRWRDTLRDLTRQPLRLEREARLEALRRRDKEHLAKLLDEDRDWLTEPVPELHPTYGEVAKEYLVKDMQLRDPTTLILIDEADRLRMTSLEQVRAIFDAGTIGVILIGMPGLEKRLARYPQFYSRIGFVHEFRPLDAAAIRQLLEQGWTPPGVRLPQLLPDPEAVAAIIRITGGNFRLLNRLLTQMERILEINSLRQVTKAVVEAARESLVIGQS